MNTMGDHFDLDFKPWLRVLDTTSVPVPPDADHARGATRYGEWDGSDGRTHAVRMTQPDWVLNQIAVLNSLDGHLTDDDVVVVAAPYELSLEGASIERAVEWMGASLISVGTSNTICPLPRLLDIVHRYQVTALVCDPQLAAELAALDRAAGRDPAASSVTTLILTRPAAPERSLRVGEAWGASTTEIFSTPIRPATATRCDHGQLHLTDDHFRAHLHTPTRGRLAPEGSRGELVLTRNCEESTEHDLPVPTGELVELPPADARCPCGSTNQLIIALGKVVDALTTPGGLITQVDVEHCLFESPYLQGGVTAQVVNDRLQVTCLVKPTPPGHRAAMSKLVESLLGPAVDVTFVDHDTNDDANATRSS